MSGWVVVLAKVLLSTAAVPTTVFPLLYMRSPWFRSWLGRATMVQSIVLAVLVDFSCFRAFFANIHNQKLFLWINVSIVILITITSSMLVYLLWTFQYRARHEGPRHGHPSLPTGEADAL